MPFLDDANFSTTSALNSSGSPTSGDCCAAVVPVGEDGGGVSIAAALFNPLPIACSLRASQILRAEISKHLLRSRYDDHLL